MLLGWVFPPLPLLTCTKACVGDSSPSVHLVTMKYTANSIHVWHNWLRVCWDGYQGTGGQTAVRGFHLWQQTCSNYKDRDLQVAGKGVPVIHNGILLKRSLPIRRIEKQLFLSGTFKTHFTEVQLTVLWKCLVSLKIQQAYEQYQRAHILPEQYNSIPLSSDFGLKTL